MAAKLKALQLWCKKQCEGYRDVQVTNMTSSFKSGLAFCAIIHRFRPDLVDYDSLSKENVFDNNKLAFDVANNELGIAALLDAEDMVAMKVPDKLCIVTYVAQYANYFRDKSPVGGPGVKGKVATKRHTPKENVEPVRDAKRPTPDTTVKQQWTTTIAPSGGQTETQAKRNTFGDKCAMCGKKVYVLERHFEGTTLYHRRCIRGSQRAASFGKAGETSGQTAMEDFGKREKKNQMSSNGSSSLLTQVNGGPKPYVASREEVGRKADTTGITGTTGMSSLLTKLRGGPVPYKGEAATTLQKARQADTQKTDWNKFLGVPTPPTGKGGHTRGMEKMDVDDDVPPPLPLSKIPPKKPPRLPETIRLSTVMEMAQPAPVERFKRVTEEQPKTAKKDMKTSLNETPENTAVHSGLLRSLATVRQDGSAGTSGPRGGSQAPPARFTLIKTNSPVSKPDTKMPNDVSHIVSTKLDQKTSRFESVQQSDKLKRGNVSGVTTKKMDSSQDLKAKIKAFEHAKDGSESKGRDVPSFCTSHKTTDQKSASTVATSLENTKYLKHSQPNSFLKSTSTNDKLNKGPTIIRPSILKNGSNSSHAKPSQPNGWDKRDGSDTKTTITSKSESPAKTNTSDSTQGVAGNNFSAFNINDSMELDSGRSSEKVKRDEKGKNEERGEKREEERAARGKPTWQVELEARGGKIPRQQVPRHGKKDAGKSESGETDWQREARRREQARGGKYADPEKTHVHIIKVSPGKTSPGPECGGSPAERMGSPAEHMGSPAERMGSPAERMGSPTEHMGSPAERMGSPAEHMGSPAERMGSPTERMGSPAKHMGSPTERMGSPKITQLKRGEVFYIKDKSDGDKSPESTEKTVEKESDRKTEWQVEAERRKWSRLPKDEATSPTPAPRHVSMLSPGGSTELARPPTVSVIMDNPARMRVKPNEVKTQWQIDEEKRKKTARNGVNLGKTVEYTKVVIENGPGRIERPYVIGQENQVKYTDVTVTTKKMIRSETRFSFNLHDFKAPADSVEPTNPVKPPPARPPTLPSRKTRRAPLPPTIIRPSQTPKRTVNAEKRMSPLEICRQLRQIDIELRDLEAEGCELEMQIRSGTDDEMDTSEDLMVQWFGLINQRNELVRKEADLMYRQKQQQLEGIHEDLEYELRCLMDKPDKEKKASERERESVLLQELLETVNMRNTIIDSMEEDRIRYIEEDQEIAEVLGMKSLGTDTQPPPKADTKAQKPIKKHQKKNGIIKPVAGVR